MYLHISSKGVKGWLEQRPVVTTQCLQDCREGVSAVEGQIRVDGLSLLWVGHAKVDLYQLLGDHLLEKGGREKGERGGGGGEGEGKGGRKRKTDRQTDRQTETETEKDRETKRGRQRERERDRQTDREIDRERGWKN